MRKVPYQNTILCSLKISVICPVYDDRIVNYRKYNWLKNSGKVGLHKASNCPITFSLLNSFFVFFVFWLCRFLFPLSRSVFLRSLRAQISPVKGGGGVGLDAGGEGSVESFT